MICPITPSLFAWETLEDSPSLKTIKSLLASIPDGELLSALRDCRGHGRNDYPVETLWGVVVLTIALRHTSIESCLQELTRNEGLRRIIGIQSESRVPKPWNMSRFLDVLGQPRHLPLLVKAFNAMVRRLGIGIPTLGVETAGDATGLNARNKAEKAAVAEVAQGLPQATGGRKEYTDAEGRVTRILEWFGFKLHLIVDSRHEVALGYKVTDTKTGDGETLPELLEQARNNLPADRIRTLAYDKAADSNGIHELLHEAGIKPVIQNRSLWKDECERVIPGRDNIVYDEAGTVYCYDMVSEPMIRRPMAFIGHEAQRGTLKYRCPACHKDFSCASAGICNVGKKYGLTVRVKQEQDLRRFPPIPRATKQFERLYRGRTAVERVNARLKVFWGADDGNITGSRRFHAFIGAVMLVHLAFATLLADAGTASGPMGVMDLGKVRDKVIRSTSP